MLQHLQTRTRHCQVRARLFRPALHAGRASRPQKTSYTYALSSKEPDSSTEYREPHWKKKTATQSMTSRRLCTDDKYRRLEAWNEEEEVSVSGCWYLCSVSLAREKMLFCLKVCICKVSASHFRLVFSLQLGSQSVLTLLLLPFVAFTMPKIFQHYSVIIGCESSSLSVFCFFCETLHSSHSS